MRLQLPPGPCAAYLAAGKFLRYLLITSGLLRLLPH